MTDQLNLTASQEDALRGRLSIDAWNQEGMGLFKLGLVTLDPLAKMCGQPTGFALTAKGRELAISLRQETENARNH